MSEPNYAVCVMNESQSNSDSVDITGVTRLKHADLWAAAKQLATKRYGGQSALARLLGVTPSEIGEWINLKACPPKTPTRAWPEGRLYKLEVVLSGLTGKSLEQLFPDALRENVGFLSASKVHERTFCVEQYALAQYAAATRERLVAAAVPVIEQDRAAIADVIGEAMSCLSFRERFVLERLYGMNDSAVSTRAEIGKELGVTSSRVAQIESKAIRKMRRPHVAERIAMALE